MVLGGKEVSEWEFMRTGNAAGGGGGTEGGREPPLPPDERRRLLPGKETHFFAGGTKKEGGEGESPVKLPFAREETNDWTEKGNVGKWGM